MADGDYKPGDEFRNVERALWLLTAFRTEYEMPLRDNRWLQDELRKFVAFSTPEEIGAELGRAVNGFVYLSSILVDALAQVSKRSADEVVALYRRQTEENIANAS